MKKSLNSAVEEWYSTRFGEFEARLNGSSQSPLHAIRKGAIQQFADSGFPTGRDEDWRHTNLNPITRATFTPILEPQPGILSPGDVDSLAIGQPEGHRLVFVNGFYDHSLSTLVTLPARVKATNLAEALVEDAENTHSLLGKNATDPGGFCALNTAFLQDGAFVQIPADVQVETPIEILYISVGQKEPTVSFPRTLVKLDSGSRATVVETYAGLEGQTYLTNSASEIFLAEDAQLNHCKIQTESARAFHVAGLHFRQSKDSRLTSHTITFGALASRNEISSRLDGEGIESTLNGLYVTGGEQHVDNHTLIEHAAPNCSSHELFKGIMSQSSTGVFRGKIYVHQLAQKTDSYQSNQNLLLSDEASVTSKPQLEIYADDVKCSHGSTTGQLDESAIFYLRSRGIDQAAAVQVLTRAFADEILDRILIERLRSELGRMVTEKLQIASGTSS